MKKLLVFLAIIACFYIIGTNLQKVSWLPFGSKGTQAAAMQNIDLIDIDASATEVTIVPGNRDDVKAEYKGKGKLKVSHSGATVKVTLKHNWLEGFTIKNKKKLTIYIPENYDQKMEVKIGSGFLHFSGKAKENPMKLKKLSIDMSSGMVNLKNLYIQSYNHVGSSGNAHLDSVIAEEGKITMSSGNVELSHYQGKLNAKLSSGRLTAQFDQVNDPININVTSGLVQLNLPKHSDFSLDGNVESGIISCDFPLDNKSKSRHNISGSYGTGENKITVKVSSGMVNIH